MSDILKLLDVKKFTDSLSVDTEHCLAYVRQQSTSNKEIVITIHVKYNCVRHWYEARQAALAKQIPFSYVGILNVFLNAKFCVQVKEDCERIEGRLRRVCGEVARRFRGKAGSDYVKLVMQKEVHIAVRADEIVSMQDIKAQLKKQNTRNEELQKENETLRRCCEHLYEEMVETQRLKTVADQNLIEVNIENDKLRIENQDLHSYIDMLGQNVNFTNSGGKLTEVGGRHQRRKLKELKSNAERALWFADTFGLKLETVSFTDEDGTSHSMSFSKKKKCSYKELSEDEQQKVKNILFVLDKFCIGEAAYHELTMVCEGEDLPKSYLIKQCKETLNKICHISRTPGQAQGAQMNFTTELESVIQSQVIYY
jgi:hypothetical protein